MKNFILVVLVLVFAATLSGCGLLIPYAIEGGALFASFKEANPSSPPPPPPTGVFQLSCGSHTIVIEDDIVRAYDISGKNVAAMKMDATTKKIVGGDETNERDKAAFLRRCFIEIGQIDLDPPPAAEPEPEPTAKVSEIPTLGFH